MEYIDSDGQILIKNIYDDGYEEYYNYNYEVHRLDGPARKWKYGYKWCELPLPKGSSFLSVSLH